MLTAQTVVAVLDQHGVKRQRMTVDSRSIVPGDVFVAIPGASHDGRDYMTAAVSLGAAAIVRESAGASTNTFAIPVIDVPSMGTHLGDVADAFYGNPSAHVRVYGVTGTNGKTSIVNWLAQAHTLLGKSCGAIGTLGVSLGTKSWPSNNTTPDAASVHTILRDLKDAGATGVAMEVSSHALELGRVSGVRFETAIFTNLTQDHLDFHGTMDAYGAAKTKLFTDYPVQHRIVNADDPFGAKIIALGLPNTLSYGLSSGDVRADVVSMSSSGMHLTLHYAGKASSVHTELIGRFNAANLMAVAATLLTEHFALDAVASVLEKLTAVPGRMQRVVTDSISGLPSVYVDYAHTPDALANALDTVRETNPQSLAVVFGCGGDRDRSKRPIMGKIAADGADRVYVTSDNPRSESPDSIVAEIVNGFVTTSACRSIVSRREAIRVAITEASAKDAVLIAGKGHESYQEIAGVRHPFSDITEAQIALTQRASKYAEARHVV
ncbi:MAG: UDP-N-acetylmuramoyl-L-alanyl-D-glutamate--2,6-diaminopimelate ligase [Casimicrobium sp.]